MKWNEMKRNEMKWNEMKWNEMKWNEMKWNEMKWNEIPQLIKGVSFFFWGGTCRWLKWQTELLQLMSQNTNLQNWNKIWYLAQK